MSCISRRFPALLLLAILVSVPAWADDRSQNLREAIAQIGSGRYDEAATAADRVIARDESDPVGHMALGVVYLHTEKLPDASAQFKAVLSSWPDEWRARYALGLIAIMNKRPADAEDQLAYLVGKPEAVAELGALRAYLASVKGESFASSDATSALARESAAMAALKAGKPGYATAMFQEVLDAPAPMGFAETRAPVVTFEAANPVAVPGGKMTWKPAQRQDVRGVSGVLSLTADAKRIDDVSFVSLYVDDSCISVTNCSPFQFSWDTTGVSNGLHHIKIEARGTGGTVVSSKSVWVRVANANAQVSTVRRPGDDELSSRLWAHIRLSASRKLAHYNLGKLYSQSGDRDEAVKQLEYAVACDPKFTAAKTLLNQLRGWGNGYQEAWRGKPGRRMVALTFDDGPNERTADMMEVINKLGVPVTFFVVGFRAELQPDLIKLMQAPNNEIMSHTYTHTFLTTLSADEAEAELSRTAAVLHSITGKPTRYFRPPGGHAGPATKEAASRQGFTPVFWTVLCSPFEGSKYESLADYVINHTVDGAIILMHNGEPATTSALPRIVRTLQQKGYKFVKLSELLANGTAPPLKPAKP